MKKRNVSVLILIAVILIAVSAAFLIQHNRYKSDIGKANADIEALQMQLRDLEEYNTVNKEILSDMIGRVDYKDETVYVIGHKTPDSDTTCSAIGMAYLLNSLGISAEARIADALNLESEYVFTELNYQVPGILEDASGKQLWLVDHSTSTQMVNGADNARIVGITDHHGIGNAEISEPICILSCPAGSTCSVVYKLCEVCGAEPPKELAGVLLAGILSDTSNLKSDIITKLDRDAVEKLKEISGITDTDALYAGMREAGLSYKGMTDTEIFYSDYKDYVYNGVRYGIGCVGVAGVDRIPAMAERMQAVIKAEMQNGCEADFILYHVYDADYTKGYTGIVSKEAGFAEGLMKGAFGGIAETQGEYYIFSPSLSRKKSIVPPINAYLGTLK